MSGFYNGGFIKKNDIFKKQIALNPEIFKKHFMNFYVLILVLITNLISTSFPCQMKLVVIFSKW